MIGTSLKSPMSGTFTSIFDQALLPRASVFESIGAAQLSAGLAPLGVDPVSRDRLGRRVLAGSN